METWWGEEEWRNGSKRRGGGAVRAKHLTEDFTHRIVVLASAKSAVWAMGRKPCMFYT